MAATQGYTYIDLRWYYDGGPVTAIWDGIYKEFESADALIVATNVQLGTNPVELSDFLVGQLGVVNGKNRYEVGETITRPSPTH